MAGVSIAAAPGFNGWTRLRDGAFKTMRAEDIAEVAAALAKDKSDCPSCQRGESMTPNHATTYIHGDTPVSKASAHSYHCRSGSRWFNPNTRVMEGRAHCTCDTCF